MATYVVGDIHGHTPTAKECFGDYPVEEGRAYFSYADINVDCGLVYDDFPERNLCAVRLEDLEKFYLYDKPMKMNEFQMKQRIAQAAWHRSNL